MKGRAIAYGLAGEAEERTNQNRGANKPAEVLGLSFICDFPAMKGREV